MRIHRLRLRNIKGIEDRDMTFPDSGVLVVEGANEIGKTSMIEALDLIFDAKDSSKAAHVRAMRPVGRDVASSIEVEFSTGPYRAVYRKQWFLSPATELTITAPAVEHLTGTPAHERVQAMLAETSDPQLWKALRLMQTSPLQLPQLGSSPGLAAALDTAAGAVTVDPQAENVVEAVEAEWRRYYTATGRETGELRAAAQAAAVAELAVRAAELAVAEVEKDIDRHAQVVDEQAQCLADLEAARGDAARLVARREEIVQVKQARDLAAERRAHAADVAAGTSSAARARAHAAAQVERLQAEHTAAQDELALVVAQAEPLLTQLRAADAAALGADPEVAAVATQTAPASEGGVSAASPVTPESSDSGDPAGSGVSSDLIDAQDAVVTARARRELAEADERHLRRVEAVRLSREALAQGFALVDELSRLREALATHDASGTRIDEGLLRRLREAERAWDRANAAHESGATRLRVKSRGADVQVAVDGRHEALDATGEVSLLAAAATTIEVPGAVWVEVLPPAGAARLAQAETAAREALERALAEAGVPDVTAAEERMRERAVLDAELSRTRHQLTVLIGSAEPAALAAREAEVVADEAEVSRYLTSRPHDAPALPSDCSEAEQRIRDALAAEKEAAAAERAAAAEAAAEHRRVATLRRDAARCQQAIARLEGQLAGGAQRLAAATEELAAARSESSDDALAAAAALADGALAERAAEVGALEELLRDLDAPRVTAELDAVTTRLPALERAASALHDERMAIEGRLDSSGGQGRYEALRHAESAHDAAVRSLTAVRRRAAAADRLRETVQRHRATTQARYVTPFADAVRRFGRAVYEDDFDVEIADDLTVQARIRDGRRIEVGALSTGAQEQLAVIVRLATAWLVDPAQGAPVVIDDALGCSDPDRLARLCAAFELLEPDSQLILLTCTPGRFDGIAGAHVERIQRTA